MTNKIPINNEKKVEELLSRYTLRLPNGVNSRDYRKLANEAHSCLEAVVRKRIKGILPKDGNITSAITAKFEAPFKIKNTYKINIEDICEEFELEIPGNSSDLEIRLSSDHYKLCFKLGDSHFELVYSFRRY